MKTIKFILLIVVGIMIMPLLSIIILSFENNEEHFLKWYSQVLNNEIFLKAFFITFIISLIVAFINTIVSFIISLSWFNKNQRLTVMILILVFGLLPADIIALSLTKISQALYLYNSNFIAIIISLVLYTLPYCVLIFWSRFYFFKKSVLDSARDIGLNEFSIVIKIILPLSAISFISCILLSFLLSFNEYSRTFYLSGYNLFISEYFNGKLSSGTDESIYAASSICILLIIITIIMWLCISKIINKKIKLV